MVLKISGKFHLLTLNRFYENEWYKVFEKNKKKFKTILAQKYLL